MSDHYREVYEEKLYEKALDMGMSEAEALAYVKKVASSMEKTKIIVVNVSGRGDKDINTVANIEGIKL